MGDAGAIVGVGLLVLAWVGVSLVAPIVALVSARRARREIELLRIEVTELRRHAAGVPPPPVARVAVVEPPAAEPPVAAESPVAAEPPVAAERVGVESPPVVVETPPIVVAEAPPPPPPIETPIAAPPIINDAPAAAEPPASSLEEKIALVWFTRIGAAILLLGVAWFFKYAVDNNWIGPLGRVALGALAGAAVLVFAEATRPRTRAIYVQVLTGVGLSLLFFTAYAAYAFYHLVPAPAAFAAVAVITLLGGALAMHHRAEPVLILSLIAGLCAPPLFSTGEDRPTALFTYLFVLTGASFWASLRMSFRWATWVAVVGPPILFAGWYGKFFDVSPPPTNPTVDAPIESLTGAYFALGRRAAPLIAVAAFFAEWVAVYASARRRSLAALWPLAILCAAALAAHAGFAALLYDRPLVLGAVLAALAFASSLLFGRENRRELLLLPLGASFIVLVATVHGASHPDVVGVMALLALWGAIYARAFLQDQFAGGRTPSSMMLWATTGVVVAVGVAAAVLLNDAHPRVFGVTLAALSLALVVLSLIAARPVVATLAVALSALGLGAVSVSVSGHEHRLIAIFAVWAAVYLGSIAWDILRRDAPVTALRLVVFSAAGLAFALLAEAQTRDAEWLLRALLLAAVGAVDLAFGATLVARARTGATVVLGQALALFAGAVAFCFSGATLTLVWAAMAAVVAVLAAADEDRAWLAGAAALFFVAACHLIAVDVPAAERARDLFFATMGNAGRLRLPLVVNERALALAGSAAALFVSARAARRAKATLFEWGAVAFVVAAHLCMLTLVVTEVHNAIVHTPSPPPGLDRAEFEAFVVQFAQALGGAENTLRMTTTLCWAVYAALLVGIGFGTRERLHRYLGLSLFAATLGKLALYDIWNLPRVYQMMVLLAVGALLLGASFLYARFGRRLVALIRDGGVDKAAAILLVTLAAARANAFDPSALEFQRTVENVSAAGLYHVEVDPELYRHSRSDALADVRIAGPDNNEVPWLVRRVPAPAQAEERAVTVVDPVQLPDGSARAVLDFGAPGLKHSEVRLAVDAAGDWFRRTRLEVSTDEKSWALLAEGAYVFRVTAAANVSSQTTLKYPTSDARYLRVTLLPSPSGPRVDITGASAAFVPPESHVPLRLLPSLKPQPLAETGEPKTNAWTVDLGAPGVPITELALEVGDPAFERRALLAAANHQAYWAPVAATLLYRVAPTATNKLAPENVRIGAGETRKRYLRLTVYNGDDAPLDVRSVSPGYVAEELVFRAATPGAYTLYVGGDVPAPSYDLAAVLARSGEQPTLAASLASVAPNPAYGHLAKPAAPPPLSERYKLPIALGLTLLLALLALWTLRLLARSRKKP